MKPGKFGSWICARLPVLECWQAAFKQYYVAKNLNIYYCFGVLAIVILANQLLTGFWLTLFYTPTVQEAFQSIEIIMRDVSFGWLFRYMHSTGASAFFIVMYLHVFRGLLYGSYQRPRELVWLLGMLLFVLLIMESFFGYLLPWGQLSYWGAQVITAIFGVIPYVGDTLVTWVRGDFSVGQPTLQRFFALHVIGIPFLLMLFTVLHIVALRYVGSSNPEGIDIQRYVDSQGKPLDAVAFYPYYVMKDWLAVMIFLLIFFGIVFFFPDMGGYFLEPANSEPANPLVTPTPMTPLWYMAPFYCMLRAVPHKLGGVLVMTAALWILFLLPWLDKSKVRSMRYKGLYSKIALTLMVASFITLGYLGTREPTRVTQILAQSATLIYFAYFLLMPLYSRLESTRAVPRRINA